MRPEPVTALFVTGVAACIVRFLTRESAAPIALAAALAALALTAHPAGVVSLAAVLVAGPRVFAWARSQLAPAVTIVSAASALLATLAFVGADLDQRVADAETTQETSVPGRDELQRYAYLWEEPFGTPLRRAFVALILLAVLAFVLRRQRTRRGLLDFPDFDSRRRSDPPGRDSEQVAVALRSAHRASGRSRSRPRRRASRATVVGRPDGKPGRCWPSARRSWPQPGRGGNAMPGTRST